MVKSVLGNITLQGFAGGMAPGQLNGVITPPGTPLVQNQIAFPNSAGQLVGDPTFTYDPVTATFTMTGVQGGSSGTQTAVNFSPTINQSNTAGYTVLDINPMQVATASGLKLLQRWATDNVTRAQVTNAGAFSVSRILAGSIGVSLSSIESANSFGTAIITVTGNTTLSDVHSTVLGNATSASFVITLPAANTATRRIYNIKKIDVSANTVTVQGNGAQTIDGTNTRVLSTQFSSLIIQCDGTAWYIIADR